MRALAAVVPFVAFALLLGNVRAHADGWRVAVVMAAVIWGVATLVFTEALSVVHGFTFGGVLASWSASAAVLALGVQPGRLVSMVRAWPWQSWPAWALLVAVVTVIVPVGVVAVVAPPNTYDSMTYHMPRVVHWIQNGTVAHYITFIDRQLRAAPFAEYAIAHLQILAGGDRLANLVQWFSMIGTMVGVSLVARLLGGDARAQVLSAVVAATVPIGVLQASSTQNDYVTALWLVCLAVLVLLASPPWLVGSALGLAVVTKPTAYLFALPLVVWFVASHVRRERLRAWRGIVVVGIVALALNAGYFARNIVTFGSPLGPGTEGQASLRYVNGSVGVPSMLSVALRNLAMHLGTPWAPVNAATEQSVSAVHRALRLDVNDPRTTWGDERFHVRRPRPDENLAPNGLHVLLIVAAVIVVVAQRRRALVRFALVPIAGFLLFSLILRWQPWHSRLELPLFMLAAPLVGIVLASRRILGPALVAVLLLQAIGPALWNTSRPIVGPRSVFRLDREAQYFATYPHLHAPYRISVERARDLGCKHVGLFMGGDDMEYPLWAIGWRLLGADVRFDHLKWSSVVPCIAVVTSWSPSLPDEFIAGNRLYRRDLSVQPLTTYLTSPGPGR